MNADVIPEIKGQKTYRPNNRLKVTGKMFSRVASRTCGNWAIETESGENDLLMDPSSGWLLEMLVKSRVEMLESSGLMGWLDG